MDTKIKIKEEDPITDDFASNNEGVLFTKVDIMQVKTDDCDMAIKTDINSDTALPQFCYQRESKCSTTHLIKCETLTPSNIHDIDVKTEIDQEAVVSEFGSQIKREFLLESPVVKDREYNSDHEMDNKIGIKEEPLWIETESSSVCDDVKDGDFPPVKSVRLCMEAVSGDSLVRLPLSSAEVSGKDTSRYNSKEHPERRTQGRNTTELPTIKEHTDLKQSGKCSHGALKMKKKNLIHKGKKAHKYKICEKGFTQLPSLKRYNLINEAKKLHQGKTSDKSFTLSNLKEHNAVHEDKKPHQCKTCDKNFTKLSHLKTHNLIHEGKRPHHCRTCDKSFTDPSTLKKHNLIHEGKKPHQCGACGKSFTRLSDLNRHNLSHEVKKPHQCKTCDKGFIQLSDLKRHNLVHEGKKPHQCEKCDKRFTDLSNLKKHNFIHEGKKPHKCKTCDKSFTRLSSLKRHNLIH